MENTLTNYELYQTTLNDVDEETRNFIQALYSEGWSALDAEDRGQLIDFAETFDEIDEDGRAIYYRGRKCGLDVKTALKLGEQGQYLYWYAREAFFNLTQQGVEPFRALDLAEKLEDLDDEAQDFCDEQERTEQTETAIERAIRYDKLSENARDVFKYLTSPDVKGSIPLMDAEQTDAGIVWNVDAALDEAEALEEYGMCFLSESDNPRAVGYAVFDKLDGAMFDHLEGDYIDPYFDLAQYCADRGIEDAETVDVTKLDRETKENYFDFAIYGQEFLGEHRTFVNRYGELWYIYD